MGAEVVYLSNVIFELYKAALAGEITQDELSTVKDIVKRARIVRQDDYKDLAVGMVMRMSSGITGSQNAA